MLVNAVGYLCAVRRRALRQARRPLPEAGPRHGGGRVGLAADRRAGPRADGPPVRGADPGGLLAAVQPARPAVFRDDVFRTLGELRAPVRATLGTFAVSAALHEYLFDLAVGRVQGYQAAFFLVQGLAVAATRKARPRGWQAAPWVAGTVAFNLATSALFFASLDEVVPFYARRP
jgi:hypothetical protein